MRWSITPLVGVRGTYTFTPKLNLNVFLQSLDQLSSNVRLRLIPRRPSDLLFLNEQRDSRRDRTARAVALTRSCCRSALPREWTTAAAAPDRRSNVALHWFKANARN